MQRCPLERHSKLELSSSIRVDDEGTYLLIVVCGVCGATGKMAAQADGWFGSIRDTSRKIFEKSASSIAFNEVVGVHHAHEIHARQRARQAVGLLKQQGMKPDETILNALWSTWKVEVSHRPLATQIVNKLWAARK